MSKEFSSHLSRRNLLVGAGKWAAGGAAAWAINSCGGGNNIHLPPLPNYNENRLLPDRLPAGVAAMIYAVVAVHTNAGPGESQSGIILDPYHVLASGHGVRNLTDGTKIPIVGCPDKINISGRDAAGHIIKASSSRIFSSFNENDYRIPDVSLIKTINPMRNSNFIPQVTVSEEPVKNGDPLFFINYQPTQQGYSRDPLSNNTNVFPAILGGTAFTRWHGDITVKLGKNYGLIPDTTLRGGASGGPVFNIRGELVGIANMVATSNGHEGFVLPVTKQLIKNISLELLQKPDACPR